MKSSPDYVLQQPPLGSCDELERSAPRGAWLLYRPDERRRVIRIG